MLKKIATLEILEGLHKWFEGLCEYGSEAWQDRMYAEGQIFACREVLDDFEYKYKEVSRGFEMKDDPAFMLGYKAFQRDYQCSRLKYNL